MSLLKNIFLGSTLATMIGCGGPTDQERIDTINKNLNGKPRVLEVFLSPTAIGTGKNLRLYDTDGDEKTVEQLVAFYGSSELGSRVKIQDLLRPEADPVYAPNDTRRREMTAAEMESIDALYQAHLATLDKFFPESN